MPAGNLDCDIEQGLKVAGNPRRCRHIEYPYEHENGLSWVRGAKLPGSIGVCEFHEECSGFQAAETTVREKIKW
jgi:hypothetical protein